MLEVREKIRYARFQHSRKSDGPNDTDKQELSELEIRERNIVDKIADAKQQSDQEEIDDTISVGYKCDQCEKIIEGTCN